MICGLLGKKLSHSYSPQIHQQLGTYRYDLFERSGEELEDFLLNGTFQGLNVTIPYKKSVIPYCRELSPQAKKMGAVNTIVKRSDGTLIGHNTDYFGFQSMAQRLPVAYRNKKVLVLGSDGASNTVCAVMKELGAQVVVISRSGENNYENLNKHADCAVIVNATPVGMYPNTGISPVSLNLFPNLEGVLDLIYNPARTKLILDAQQRGIPTENGLWMLVAQAKESAEWFTGENISDNKIAHIYKAIKRNMENIVLIGMPGCGKSTVGALLAQQLGKKFVDADAQIEIHAGCTIPEIFQNQQEEGFRKIETKVLSELGKQSGMVIATGGGCVTRQENLPLLRQNGTIVWIKRNIAELPTDGRPLSLTTDLLQMFETRKPMYEKFADITVNNDSTPTETATRILSKLEETE
ncbi:MAG: shikimate kinase [Oscillospiraceae bacterium]|nr:shikimate kinase [Oscillospiraceae bacterium]